MLGNRAAPRYSSRNTSIGSTRAARLAGDQQASIATVTSGARARCVNPGDCGSLPAYEPREFGYTFTRTEQADHDADDGESHAFRHDESSHVRQVLAERDANADLPTALRHGVTQHAVHADHGQRERERATFVHSLHGALV